MSTPKDWTGRCVAQVKYIHGWRCTRMAAGDDGLCLNHHLHGAMVPERWENEVNEHGVNVPTGIKPWTKVPPTRKVLA